MTSYETSQNKSGPSVDFIMSQFTYLRSLYAPRNAEFSILRKLFDGDFASMQDAKADNAQMFNDRIKVVYNLTNATVRRYMDSMSQPPRIEATSLGFEKNDLELADAKTKMLQYLWRKNNMPTQIMMASFYQSLLDKAIFHVRPAPELPCKVAYELAIPDNFMPMPSGDNWMNFPFVIYAFRKLEPNDITINPLTSQPETVFSNVVTYWDATSYVRLENGVEKLRIPHKLGHAFWHMAHNIPIPHRFRGQGDMDQAVGLNEYLNMLFSDMADMINYAANPIAVVRGSKAGATNLPFAPRAVWELERDGQAGFLQWSGAPPTAEAQILRTIQAIEDASGVSSPAFGREIPSGTSGSAVRSLLAGFTNRLGSKQQFMGEALARANSSALMILEQLFPNEKFDLQGEMPGGGNRAFTIQPKEFRGFYENKIVFEPLDPTSRHFTEMDKLEKGIQSRYTTMRNLGIENISDELKRMEIERKEMAMHENDLALGRRGELPPPGLPSSGDGAAPTLDPASLLDDPANSDALTELLGGYLPKSKKDAKGNVVPAATGSSDVGGPTATSALPDLGERVGIDQVIERLKGLQLGGAAYLAGKTATDGFSAGALDFVVQNPADRQLISKALGGLSPRARFSEIPASAVPPEGAVDLAALLKKKVGSGDGVVTLDAFLPLVVMEIDRTPSKAWVYTVGAMSQGRLTPIAKTFPQNKVEAERGELIVVHVDGLSKKGNKYALVKPQVIVPKSAPAAPTTFEKIQDLYAKAKEAK